MPDRIQPTDPSNNKAAQSISIRTIAILVMLVGAAGFVFTLVYFGREQVVCLSASTLVTLAGLGFLIAARRKGWEGRIPLPTQEPRAQEPVHQGRIPSGLREPKSPVQPIIETPQPVSPPEILQGEPVPNESDNSVLLGRVISQFQSQGAHVQVQRRQAERSILHIHAGGGQTAVALVLEGGAPVEIGDARALNALVTSLGAGRGFLIATGAVSQDAADYAASHGLRLVDLQELSALVL